MRKIQTFLLTLCVAGMLCGCGKTAEEANTQGENVAVEGEEAVVDAGGNVVEEVQNTEPEVLAEAEPTEEVVEETIAEEPQVEMVDFETWAQQEDHDEVCLVVWNEERGVQEIMPTVKESKKTYKIQEGDKFAIPHRINISYILVNDEQCPPFDDTGYSEVVLKAGELTQLTIGYKNEKNEDVILSYLFK